MSKEQRNVLTTEQAAKRLRVSRATFFMRLKNFPNIKPVNYNPNLMRQHNPMWYVEDVDKLGTPMDTSITGQSLEDSQSM